MLQFAKEQVNNDMKIPKVSILALQISRKHASPSLNTGKVVAPI